MLTLSSNFDTPKIALMEGLFWSISKFMGPIQFFFLLHTPAVDFAVDCVVGLTFLKVKIMLTSVNTVGVKEW